MKESVEVARVGQKTLPGWAIKLLELECEAQAFADFAQQCEHRVDDKRRAACNYHRQSLIDCGPASCPIFEKMRSCE
jgi:hypothetical protein